MLFTTADTGSTPAAYMLGELLNALPPEVLAALLPQPVPRTRPAIGDQPRPTVPAVRPSV